MASEFITRVEHDKDEPYTVIFRTDDADKYKHIEDECRRMIGHEQPTVNAVPVVRCKDCADGERREGMALIEKNKLILDATCGTRGIWFQKNEPHTLYCDERRVHYESDYGTNKSHRVIDVQPDMEIDFTNMPFADNSFSLVIIDPPHLVGLNDSAWLKKQYCGYATKEEALEQVGKAVRECMRVLKPNGVLVFKWSELRISTREVIDAIGAEPLFGHRSGKKMNTHWMCFMKFADG